MRIVLFGAPGCGKGTQAGVLVEKFGVPHISTGDLLRAEMASGSALGKKVKAIMDTGDFVSNEFVLEMIGNRLRQSDTRRGFILDGFPRNIPQAQALDSSLALMGRSLQLALYITVDNDLLLKRLTGRITCASCGAIYNQYFSKPKKRGICDQCGSDKLERRSDDNKKTVKSRLETFLTETEPLIAYYRAQHKLRTVNGEEKISAISEKIIDIINSEIRPLDIKVVDVAVDDVYVTDSNKIIAGGAVVKTDSENTVRRKIPSSRTIEKVKEPVGEKTTRKRKKRAKAGKEKELLTPTEEASSSKKRKASAVKEKPKRKGAKKVTKKPTVKKAGKKVTAKKKKTVAKKSTSKKKSTKKISKKKPVRKTIRKKTQIKKKTSGKKATIKKKVSRKKKISKKKKVNKKKKVTAKKRTKKKAVAKKTTRKQRKKTTKKSVKKKPVAKSAKKISVKKTAARKTRRR